MLVLFDNGTPRTLARYLIDHHAVTEARARGWEELENGELLNVGRGRRVRGAGDDGQESQLSTKPRGRKIALVVLGQGRWSLIRPCVPQVVAAVNAATPGSFAEIDIPFR